MQAVMVAWQRAWRQVIPYFARPRLRRKVVYPTHAIRSVHACSRTLVKMHGPLPGAAASKLIGRALRYSTA